MITTCVHAFTLHNKLNWKIRTCEYIFLLLTFMHYLRGGLIGFWEKRMLICPGASALRRFSTSVHTVIWYLKITWMHDRNYIVYASFIYIYIYIYIYIRLKIKPNSVRIRLYKRLEASDNHTIYLSHWISKLL